MRVLHLSGSKHHWSGNEQQLADLIRNLGPVGTESAIFCFEGSAIEQYATGKGITHFSYPKGSVYSFSLASALKRCVRQYKPDVIHVHTSNFLTLYVITDMLFRLHTPCIFSRKGMTERANFLSRAKYNYRNIDGIICVSGAVCRNFKQFLSPHNQDKTVVIYDGISVEATPPTDSQAPSIHEMFGIPQGKYLIGSIANHVYAKNLEVLVQTLDVLVNRLGRKDIVVLQIGDKTELTDELIHLREEKGLGEHLFFAGKVENARRFMPQFDLLLMTSRLEGLPLTIYEAFMYRVPVVTTNAGGIAEAVTDHHNGILTEIGDYEALARGVDELLCDDVLRRDIATAAHDTLTRFFTAQRCGELTNNLYQEVIQKRI